MAWMVSPRSSASCVCTREREWRKLWNWLIERISHFPQTGGRRRGKVEKGEKCRLINHIITCSLQHWNCWTSGCSSSSVFCRLCGHLSFAFVVVFCKLHHPLSSSSSSRQSNHLARLHRSDGNVRRHSIQSHNWGVQISLSISFVIRQSASMIILCMEIH